MGNQPTYPTCYHGQPAKLTNWLTWPTSQLTQLVNMANQPTCYHGQPVNVANIPNSQPRLDTQLILSSKSVCYRCFRGRLSMSTFSWVYKSYTFWDPPPPPKYTSTFFECQKSRWNNKNQAKTLKVYWKNVDFHSPPPPKKCMVCTLVKMLTFMDGPLMVLLVTIASYYNYISIWPYHVLIYSSIFLMRLFPVHAVCLLGQGIAC